MGDLEAETPLHLVSSITIASFWLPGLLKRFSELCPRTPVEVEVISAGEALEVLRSGGADLALVEGPPPQGAVCLHPICLLPPCGCLRPAIPPEKRRAYPPGPVRGKAAPAPKGECDPGCL